jgi:hypothetical protein
MKGKTTGAKLYEEAKKVLSSLGIPVQKLAWLVTSGAPCLAGRNSGAYSLITKRRKEYLICVRNPSKWRILLWWFLETSIFLCRKEWFVVNLEIYWVIWNLNTEMFSTILKFVGCVVVRCLNACMTWKSRIGFFLGKKGGGDLSLSFVSTIECSIRVLYWHYSNIWMDWTSAHKEWITLSMNCSIK